MRHRVELEEERRAIFAYVQLHLARSPLFEAAGGAALFKRRHEIEIFSGSGLPSHYNFRMGWHGSLKEATATLVDDLECYLDTSSERVCLLEDPSASPRDQNLLQGPPGPAWFDEDRVYWPIQKTERRRGSIEDILAWGASGAVIVIGYCGHLPAVDATSSRPVERAWLRQVGNSLDSLVTDIFDQEAYVKLAFTPPDSRV